MLKQIDDVVWSNGQHSANWLCKCECGNIREVEGRRLVSGNSQSCGCYNKESVISRNKNRAENLIGMKFERLTVINRVPNHMGRVAWNCICECGNQTIVSSHDLKSGNTKSCGCLRKEQYETNGVKNGIDLLGLRFGRLIVVEKVSSKQIHNRPAWRCVCDCGKEIITNASRLRNGSVKSCGCYAKEVNYIKSLIDLTGKKYGNLIVIRKLGRKSHDMLWECKCKCGNVCNISSRQLRYGSTNGCPECDDKRSRGERAISTYLKGNNIVFEVQKRFFDCRYKRTLPFDFYIPTQNIAIEYDGEQHFQPVNLGGMNNEEADLAFKETQTRDRIKTKYCSTHNIKLIRIPYTQFDNIEAILNQQFT